MACKQIGSNDVAICQKTRGTIWPILACVCATGMRSDLRPLHAHAHTHLADLHTYAGVPRGDEDCVIGGTTSRNDRFEEDRPIQRCSFPFVSYAKGVKDEGCDETWQIYTG